MGYLYTDERRQHLHSFDGKPLFGTSTVAKMAGGDKGGLIWWAAGCAAGTFGWLKKLDTRKFSPEECAQREIERRAAAVAKLEELRNMSIEAYQTMLDAAYKAHDTIKRKKADEGTERHAKLEDYVKACIAEGGAPKAVDHWLPGFFAPEVESFITWSLTNVRKFLWCEVNCYSTTLWTGGIADIGYEDMQGRVVAGDHKSSDQAYFDQFIQIAGYDLQLSENGGFDTQGNKVFELPAPVDYYVVFPFRSVPFTPMFIYDVEGYREGFKSALKLHKLNEQFKELLTN